MSVDDGRSSDFMLVRSGEAADRKQALETWLR